MPNFVDCAVFRPVQSNGEKQTLRAGLGIPEEAFVVGCVAAVKKNHKRIDYLIREFACIHNVGGALRAATGSGRSQEITVAAAERASHIEEKSISREAAKDAKLGDVIPAEGGAENSSLRASRLRVKPSFALPFLLIAGARTSETAELIALAESLIPGRYKIVTDCARSQMPDLYRVMDVFVLTSLFEMMPIALLEALASGLPCVVNQHPVLEWMIGAGETLDVRCEPLDAQEKKNFEQKSAKDTKGENCFSAGGGKESSSLRSSRSSVQNSCSVGGMAINMSGEGALAQSLAALTPDWLELHGRQARERAEKMFSKEAVIGRYVEYYREVLRDESPSLIKKRSFSRY